MKKMLSWAWEFLNEVRWPTWAVIVLEMFWMFVGYAIGKGMR